ncbi:MAG: Lrp/AsnC family transcriptional regulator [Planctomycetota bacterium]
MPRRGSLSNFPSELDLAVISQLQSDARKPFTAIAEELGVPESTVRKRVDKMESAGVIRFTGFADPLRLGFQYWSWISINVELAALEKTARALAQYPEIFFVGITSGPTHLFSAGVFRSNDDLFDFLNVRIGKLGGIVETSTSNVLRILKRTGHLFSEAHQSTEGGRAARNEPEEHRQISPVDLKIISVLQSDGRKSFAQVASMIGVAESTVHSRVSRLKDLGILQFEAYVDPLRLGYPNWTLFYFRVAPRQALSVGTQLAHMNELFFVGITTGTSDIAAAGVFRSNEDQLSFLTNRIAKISSIEAVTTTNVLRLVKRQLAYPLAEVAGGKLKGG